MKLAFFLPVLSFLLLLISGYGTNAFMATTRTSSFLLRQQTFVTTGDCEGLGITFSSSPLPLRYSTKTCRTSSVQDSIQDKQELIYPSKKSPKFSCSRRRVLNKGATRMLTILATALGVTRRFSRKVYAMEDDDSVSHEDISLSRRDDSKLEE